MNKIMKIVENDLGRDTELTYLLFEYKNDKQLERNIAVYICKEAV